MMHMQANEYPAQHRADEPIHKASIPPPINPDRYAAEMADLDIREAAGEFNGDGVIHHWNDPVYAWPALRGYANKKGIIAAIITQGDPEPEGAELILIRRRHEEN